MNGELFFPVFQPDICEQIMNKMLTEVERMSSFFQNIFSLIRAFFGKTLLRLSGIWCIM